MKTPSLKIQGVQALLLSLTTLALACGDTPSQSGTLVRGTTNRGEELLVPAAQLAAQSLYTPPEGARTVSDPAGARFLVLTTDGARHYALADVVSCGTGLAVRVEGRIGCSTADSPTVGRSYLALERAAQEASDQEVLATPEVELLADASRGLPCALPPADFADVLARLRADLATEAGSAKALTWVPVRYGSPALVELPSVLLEGGMDGMSVHSYDYGGAGASCSCTEGTCTLKSTIGAKWCDSTSCTGTCTLSN